MDLLALLDEARVQIVPALDVVLQQLGRFAEDRPEPALATAYCSTLRLKLLKIGARVRVTARKVWVSLGSSYPYEALFARAYDQLQRAGPIPA